VKMVVKMAVMMVVIMVALMVVLMVVTKVHNNHLLSFSQSKHRQFLFSLYK
jgi:hypothetical protein